MRKETKNKSTKNCKLNNIYLLKNTKKKRKTLKSNPTSTY